MNTENNKLIALFGGDIKSMDDKASFTKNCSVNELDYHSNWNSLMEVVFKIVNMGVFVRYDNNKFYGKISKFEIKSTHTAVVEFIKWYNQTQNTEPKA